MIRRILFITLIAAFAACAAACGCEKNEWEVPLVCTDGAGNPDAVTKCVKCAQGAGNACTPGDAVAVALGLQGGCTQDGAPVKPKECSGCN